MSLLFEAVNLQPTGARMFRVPQLLIIVVNKDYWKIE